MLTVVNLHECTVICVFLCRKGSFKLILSRISSFCSVVRCDHRAASPLASVSPSSSLLHLSTDACCASKMSAHSPLPSRLPSLEVRTAG